MHVIYFVAVLAMMLATRGDAAKKKRHSKPVSVSDCGELHLSTGTCNLYNMFQQRLTAKGVLEMNR